MHKPTMPDRLQKVDKLTYCSGMDSPPLVSFDEAQKPKGLTVDPGVEIVRHLGRQEDRVAGDSVLWIAPGVGRSLC
jgi:hypothetical protein